MNKAPNTWNGLTKDYEEVFVSVFHYPTKESAERVLNRIRNEHSEEKNWLEISSNIEETIDGFRAVRHHAHYK